MLASKKPYRSCSCSGVQGMLWDEFEHFTDLRKPPCVGIILPLALGSCLWKGSELYPGSACGEVGQGPRDSTLIHRLYDYINEFGRRLLQDLSLERENAGECTEGREVFESDVETGISARATAQPPWQMGPMKSDLVHCRIVWWAEEGGWNRRGHGKEHDFTPRTLAYVKPRSARCYQTKCDTDIAADPGDSGATGAEAFQQWRAQSRTGSKAICRPQARGRFVGSSATSTFSSAAHWAKASWASS